MIKKIIGFDIVISILLPIITCSGTYIKVDSNINNDNEISKDSLKKMIGQMIIVGFRGTEITFDSKIAKDIKNGKIGGVILFDKDILLKNSRNIESPGQVKKLNSQLQSYSSIPLFISIDQEGGSVVRLKKNKGFLINSVSEEYLGKIDNPDSTTKYAEMIAKELSWLGINLNFSPVVDLNINPENPVIGFYHRSFSSNPDIVYKHAKLFINVYHSYGISAAIKHFPGHGSSTVDSHHGIADITSTWKDTELIPFQRLIKSGDCDIIMTGHMFNSKIDSVYPTTLSNKAITGLLRDSIHYKGVIISDDLQMKAITSQYNLKSIVELSIKSGIDILLFGNNIEYDEDLPDKIINIILEMIEKGEISTQRIIDSYKRIIELKSKHIKAKNIFLTNFKFENVTTNFLLGKIDQYHDSLFALVGSQYTYKKNIYILKETYSAFINMCNAAKKDGVNLQIVSGTRNFNEQKIIWENKWNGKTMVNGSNLTLSIPNETNRAKIILKYSAMPGISRHHWGTDIDINSVDSSYFTKEKGIQEYEWLKNHAINYGFCQPYTQKGESRPYGHEEEKWHWSYIPIAERIHQIYIFRITVDKINVFFGSNTAKQIDVINKYVNGINSQCE